MNAETLTEKNFEDFIKSNDKVLVDFFDPQDSQFRDGQSQLEVAVRTARHAGSKVPVAKVDVSKDLALAKKWVPEGSQYPQLMWFLHGEPTQYHRTLRTAKAIVDFVLALDRDPVVKVKTEAEARDFVPSVFAQISRSSPMYKLLEVVASKHMDTVAVTFLESSKNVVSWLGNDTDPTAYTGESSAAAFDRWVRGNLVKSEAIPEDPTELEDEGSKVVVGKSFEDIVLQMDKDVILQVYAPWCGFCKKFSPTWNSLAREVAEVSHLVVAKMDGSRNGSPMPEVFKWEAYPKVIYVKAGTQKPIYFEGNRTVENLLDFIGKHSSKPLQLQASGRKDDDSVLDL
jgi:protein disulfide-isomerase-like protein